jgi:hypothetical protein
MDHGNPPPWEPNGLPRDIGASISIADGSGCAYWQFYAFPGTVMKRACRQAVAKPMLPAVIRWPNCFATEAREVQMEASRFDAWTRRRLGGVMAGALGGLLGLAARDEGAAKKKRCRKAGKSCKRGKDCCGSLRCAQAGDPGHLRCCRNDGGACTDGNDCCGELLCAMDGTCQLPTSDRALKANFGSVDPADMLSRVRALPIATWNYTSDDASIRHIGPMAQDFAATFGVGADNRHIHPLDGQGIALAAIQGLSSELAVLREENLALAWRLAKLERCQEPPKETDVESKP